MRITINIEDSVFEEIVSMTNARTKTQAVNVALREYVRLKRKQKLIELSGKVQVEENWKALREMERH